MKHIFFMENISIQNMLSTGINCVFRKKLDLFFRIRNILCFNVSFLVPKPRLGNALAGEAPASRDGDGPKQGLRAQMRSQAGAWERGKMPSGRSRRIDKSAGNAWDLSIPGEHFGKTSDLLNLPIVFSFPSRGLGTRKNALRPLPAD